MDLDEKRWTLVRTLLCGVGHDRRSPAVKGANEVSRQIRRFRIFRWTVPGVGPTSSNSRTG